MLISRQQITAVVLAGGKGSRFGGVDKGLIKLKGLPLVEHIIARTQPQVGEIMISANRNLEQYANFGFAVFQDDLEGFLGPLAGILTALKHCETEWLLSVPADSPFVPSNLALHLSEKIQDTKIAIPHDGKYLQPTFSLINKSLTSSLEYFLQQGGRKARVWMQQQEHVIVDFSEHTHAFININTEDELFYAEEHFEQFMA